MARWLEAVSAFESDIQHRPGRLHGNSAGMSRIPCGKECTRCNPRKKTIRKEEDGQTNNKEDEEARSLLAKEQMPDRRKIIERTWRNRNIHARAAQDHPEGDPPK